MTISYADVPFALPATRHVVVELTGEPVAKGRPRFGRGYAYTPDVTRNYQNALAYAANLAMRGALPLTGPLRAELFVGLPIPQSWPAKKRSDALSGLIWPDVRPDGDNYEKMAWDALKGIAFADDKQIVRWSGVKKYTDKPRMRIEIEAVLWEAADAWQPIGAAAKRVVEKIGDK